nr:NAD-dependent epimerase/dehydratase family protein [Pseudarthrobacter psychrotolerans]
MRRRRCHGNIARGPRSGALPVRPGAGSVRRNTLRRWRGERGDVPGVFRRRGLRRVQHTPIHRTQSRAAAGPYGFAKLRAEATVSDFARRTGVRTLIGRVSNLYGPGQNLRKPQGLISVFAKAHLTGAPVSVYVSLDTLRDYLFVDDASRLVADGLDRLIGSDVRPGEAVVKILASQRADTIGNLIGACRAIFKRRPLIILGASPFAKAQAHDLRLKSVVWPELDAHPVTPLAVGINTTVQEVQRLALSGQL